MVPKNWTTPCSFLSLGILTVPHFYPSNPLNGAGKLDYPLFVCAVLLSNTPKNGAGKLGYPLLVSSGDLRNTLKNGVKKLDYSCLVVVELSPYTSKNGAGKLGYSCLVFVSRYLNHSVFSPSPSCSLSPPSLFLPPYMPFSSTQYRVFFLLI